MPTDSPQDHVLAFEELSETDRTALGLTVEIITDEWMSDLDSGSLNYISSAVPNLFHERANEYRFMLKMFLCLTAIGAKLADPRGWRGLSCLAEELVMREIIEGAKVRTELNPDDPSLSEDGAGLLWDLAFTDLDHELLFDPSWDGIENSPEDGPPGMVSMKFEDWFKPFGGEGVHVYLRND